MQAGQAAGVEAVLAVGGGRIIDLAKLAAFGLGAGNSIIDFIHNKKCQSDPLPLVAIPSTAGSGSQATHFAVVFQERKKYSLAHRALLPQASIVDSRLLDSCSPRLIATSGLDALCQGIESLWSVRSTEESRFYAREAITSLPSSPSQLLSIQNKGQPWTTWQEAPIWPERPSISVSPPRRTHVVTYSRLQYDVSPRACCCLDAGSAFAGQLHPARRPGLLQRSSRPRICRVTEFAKFAPSLVSRAPPAYQTHSTNLFAN